MVTSLKLIYLANVFVAGWVGISSLFFTKSAVYSVFSNAYSSSEFIKLVGALWLGIAVLSLLGLWKPLVFTPVLILQLFYKFAWLVVVAIPAITQGQTFPKPMAMFFVIWVIVLPFVIPWKNIFSPAF